MLTFPVGTGRVHTLAYTPDSLSLVVDVRGEPLLHRFTDNPTRFATELVWWEIATGTATRRVQLGRSSADPSEPQGAIDVSFTFDPPRIAVALNWNSDCDAVIVADLVCGTVIDTFQTERDAAVRRVSLSPDGSRIFLAATGYAVVPLHVWEWKRYSVTEWQVDEETNLEQEVEVTVEGYVHQADAYFSFPGHSANIAFDGRVGVAAGDSPLLLVWDTLSIRPVAEPASDAIPAEQDDLPDGRAELPLPYAPQCVAFALGGSRLAVGGAGLALVNPFTLDRTKLPRSGNGIITAVAFGVDSRELLAGTDAGTVEVWDTASGQLTRAFDWEQGPISAVAVAPDGATFAAGTETGQVVVWDRGE